MREVLVSGCRDIQYSYDAKIGTPVPRRDDVLRAAGARTGALEHELRGLGAARRHVAAPTAATTRSPQLEGAVPTPRRARCSGERAASLLGHVLTVDADRRTHRRGAVYIHDGRIERVADESSRAARRVRRRAACAGRRRRRARAHRPAQPSRVQHAAALGRPDRGRTATRYQWPRAATYGPDVSNPGAGARHRRAGRRVALRGGEGGGRRRHRASRVRRR